MSDLGCVTLYTESPSMQNHAVHNRHYRFALSRDGKTGALTSMLLPFPKERSVVNNTHPALCLKKCSEGRPKEMSSWCAACISEGFSVAEVAYLCWRLSVGLTGFGSAVLPKPTNPLLLVCMSSGSSFFFFFNTKSKHCSLI